MTASSRTIARNFSALVIGSLLSKGVLFGWQLVLGNWFSPTDYGIYNTVLSLLSVSTAIVSFGMGLVAVREVARQPALAGRIWSAMLVAQTALALGAYLGALGVGILAGYSPIILAYLAIAGISLWVDLFGNTAYDMLIAQERMVATAWVEIVHIGVRVLVAWLALQAGWGLFGVYAVTIVVGAGRSLALCAVNVRGGVRPHFPLDRAITLGLLRDGAPLAFSAFLYLAYQHADKLMTTAFIGETNTGYLGPAFVINYGVIELVSTTLLTAIYPLLSRYSSEHPHAFGDLIEKLGRFMLMVGVPIALVLSLYAEQIILTLYNPLYLPTVGVLQILIWYTVLTMIGNPFSRALLVQNRQRVLLRVRGVALVVNVACNALFLWWTGDPRGTAIASVLAELIALILLARAFHAAGFSWARVLPRAGRVLVAGMAAGAVMLAFAPFSWVVGAMMGGLVYAGACVLLGALGQDDWALVASVTSAFRKAN